ncbi:uncharacterized protein BCR38DRAFT_238396 [Pseudomassariella vexata]|uniref:Rhodopsin domain-containing protein n=1 Tax=Pseudomassariella vexata TaxID=1141098 RepID=A0A1Y2DSW8_9PEZI|nr:uncharacterized protein BCR38DRAFT_238396 [Pseudomassariella vexata]ORY62362.1 hypothetical protein BCR38DRAFT_238396 [Pseudomassariella vexata]
MSMNTTVEAHYSEAQPLQNRPSTIIAVIVSFLTVAYLCVGFRLYIRLKVVYAPGWDDLFVFLAVLSGSISSVVSCGLTRYGLGDHFYNQGFSKKLMFMKLFWISDACFNTSNTFIKLSVLFQYLRIFNRGRMRKLSVCLIVFVSLWGLTFAFMSWVPCFPIENYWKGQKHCYALGSRNHTEFYGTILAANGSNMALDLIILAVSVPLYFRRETAQKTKRGLLSLLFMGLVINLLAAWRLVSIVKTQGGVGPHQDPTWYGTLPVLIADMENLTSIMCASIPVFWPVLTESIDKIFVTHEVTIERSTRFSLVGDGYADDGVNLHGLICGDGQHSQPTSQASLNPKDSTKSPRLEVPPGTYYVDKYFTGHLEPWSSSRQVESVISAQNIEGRGRTAECSDAANYSM